MKTLVTLSLLFCGISVFAQTTKKTNTWGFTTTITTDDGDGQTSKASMAVNGSGNSTLVTDPAGKLINLTKTDDITTVQEGGQTTFVVKDVGTVVTVTTATGAKVSIINNGKSTKVYGPNALNMKIESSDTQAQITFGKDSTFTIGHLPSQSTLVKADGTQLTFTQGEQTSSVKYPGIGRGYIINIGNVSPVINPDGSHSVWVFNGSIATIVNTDGTYAIIIK